MQLFLLLSCSSALKTQPDTAEIMSDSPLDPSDDSASESQDSEQDTQEQDTQEQDTQEQDTQESEPEPEIVRFIAMGDGGEGNLHRGGP